MYEPADVENLPRASKDEIRESMRFADSGDEGFIEYDEYCERYIWIGKVDAPFTKQDYEAALLDL